jgi:ubiquinone/menaquinone biosynthesis C-methylase UbiE
MAFISSFRNRLRRLLYNPLVGKYTVTLYADFLSQCTHGSQILDIGIGNGYSLCNNASIIKRRNLKIHGIDICESSLEECRQNIKEFGLEDHVTVSNEPLSAFADSSTPWNYVYLSNSYSVIDNAVRLLDGALDVVRSEGKVMLSLTLFDEWSSRMAFIKPRLKHLLGFDFGRYITHTVLTEELQTIDACIVDKWRVTKTGFMGNNYASLYTCVIERQRPA